MNTPKDVGFHNIDQNLINFKLRIDGTEVGDVLTHKEAVENCDFLKKLYGMETWEEHFEKGGDARQAKGLIEPG